MKTITLHQPWATLVARGLKQIETRSWSTKHRGWLAIHAAKTTPRSSLLKALRKPLHSWIDSIGYNSPYKLPTGQILAIAYLTDVYPIIDDYRIRIDDTIHAISNPELSFGHYAPGRYAWMLPYVINLNQPRPARGHQRLWNWRPTTCPICTSSTIIQETGFCAPCWRNLNLNLNLNLSLSNALLHSQPSVRATLVVAPGEHQK